MNVLLCLMELAFCFLASICERTIRHDSQQRTAVIHLLLNVGGGGAGGGARPGCAMPLSKLPVLGRPTNGLE